MEVGDQLSDSEHFKDALRNSAIKRDFNFTFIKNDEQRVTIKCAAEGCEWRAHVSMEGKEVAKEVLHGSEVASYDLLMWYAKKVLMTNPGRVAIVENDGPRFKSAFFAFKACVIGFKTGCRPLLYLDGTHLLGKYGGTFLGSTGKDGNDGFFHMAFAIVDNETDANWTWFLSKLGDTIYDDDEYVKLITIISDRSKGLINAVAKKPDLADWANYMFKGERWGEMYSNVAESFNAWIKEARHLPVTNMVDSIRFKLIGMLCHRHEQSHRWERRLCPVIHRKIEELVEESRNLLVGRSDGDHFEVVDQKNYCISLNAQTCSCQAIFSVPDNDKPDDINHELLVRPPITKKPVGRPRRKRLESQASIIHELQCSHCHDAGHNRRSCNASIADRLHDVIYVQLATTKAYARHLSSMN
ncbi:uncharacterized protein LOC120277712 [Dioscorea cayenensis subsp. rotundata]|uniref:Uncharacterized protein LOC120277712 n=1 Tax=Dioscorea cayennensis subsp. rotundata TaxID=55577 RepID=A0AB40CKJ0_DIOCR|nr:uncharacterized protein LOC120277712 [Dioscorea cayenensis subsp. rotundata]